MQIEYCLSAPPSVKVQAYNIAVLLVGIHPVAWHYAVPIDGEIYLELSGDLLSTAPPPLSLSTLQFLF